MCAIQLKLLNQPKIVPLPQKNNRVTQKNGKLTIQCPKGSLKGTPSDNRSAYDELWLFITPLAVSQSKCQKQVPKK